MISQTNDEIAPGRRKPLHVDHQTLTESSLLLGSTFVVFPLFSHCCVSVWPC
ncbi:hypothetical protein Mapa_004995 [Marchantia paleacea]|nr:hypothetical protein Mapa_004995 [Marchantia paleacea]